LKLNMDGTIAELKEERVIGPCLRGSYLEPISKGFVA